MQHAKHHDGKLILPGSFNPLHEGHQQMLNVAESVTGLTGAYELTLRNADKPDLDYLTLQERLDGLTSYPVWLTNLTNFEQKAEQFSGAIFAWARHSGAHRAATLLRTTKTACCKPSTTSFNTTLRF